MASAHADGGPICVILSILAVIGLFMKKDEQGGSSSSYGGIPRGRMNAFEIRTREEMRGDEKNISVVVIEARGLVPVYTTCDVDFVVFAMDVTDGEPQPVYCTIEQFQMPDSTAYRCHKKGLSFSPNEGFGDWQEIGVAPKDCLVGPKSGRRSLRFYGMAVRRAPESTKIKEFSHIASDSAVTSVTLSHVGYKERNEKRIDAIKLSIQLGIAVAYTDGRLEPSEASSIKEWSAKRLEELPDAEKAAAKEKINAAIRDAFEQAKSGSLNVDSAAKELRDSPLAGVEMQALELCVKVMAADGIVDPKELEIVRRIGNLLGISYDDIRNLTDKHPPTSTSQPGSADLTDEQFVGIEPGLPDEAVRKEIRRLFGTYNARLSTEKDAAKRANYQRKLEALARLKQKHG